MASKLKIDFLTVAMPAGEAFSSVLKDVANLPDDASRNVLVGKNPLRLKTVERVGQAWCGDLVRIRMEEIPVRASTNGAVTPFTLREDEGVGEQCAFLYRPKRRLLLLQRNRHALSANTFASYFESIGKLGGPIDLQPLLKPDAAARLRNLRLVRRVSLKVAATDRGALWKGEGVGVKEVAELANQFRSPEVTVTLSVGRKRQQGLFGRGVRQMVTHAKALAGRGAEVKALVVAGKDDDGAPDVIDFIHDRLRDEVELSGAQRLLSYEIRRDALATAWRRQRAVVESLLDRRSGG